MTIQSCSKLSKSKAKSLILESTPKDTFVVDIPPNCIKNVHGYGHSGYNLDDVQNENVVKMNNYLNLMLQEGYLEKIEGSHTTSSGSCSTLDFSVTEKGKEFYSESRSFLLNNTVYPKHLSFVVYDAEIDQINSIQFPLDGYAEVIYTKKNNNLNALGKLLNMEQKTDSRTYKKTLVKCDAGWCINK